MAEITQLLRRWSEGDPQAFEVLFPLVYRELRLTAGALMRGERPQHTLQPTALVNEAYLRLCDQQLHFLNRRHFCGVAGQIMRRVLVDHAREHLALKRGEGQRLLSLEALSPGQQGAAKSGSFAVDLLDLNEALNQLEAELPQHARVVEYRYFGGLTIEETAAMMDLSIPTVARYWAFAKAWLHRQLAGGADTDSC